MVIACGGDESSAQSAAQMRKTALSILNAPQEMADSATLDLDHFGPWRSRVAIEVPSARGAEPALALVYGSSGPNGHVGHGWRLTGFSTITAKSFAMGIAAGNQTDRYFLDGAELVSCTSLVSSTPSCDAGGNYAFLDENFHRVKKTDFGWSTWAPNGTETRYEAAGDGRWTQSEVVDRNGQRAVYAYTSVSGQLYPESVTYGFDASGAHQSAIVFHYETRPDALSHASRDGLVDGTQRLASISVHSRGTAKGPLLVRAYNLGYDDARTDTAGSFLSSVQQVGSDGVLQLDQRYRGSKLPAVQFERAAPLIGGFDETAQLGLTVPPASPQTTAEFTVSLDTQLSTLPANTSLRLSTTSANRDGAPDFFGVVTPQSTTTGAVELLSAVGPHVLPASGVFAVARTPTSLDRESTVLRPDIDGDGMADLVAIKGRSVSVARGKPDGTLGAMSTNGVLIMHDKGNRFLLGDFDGDGRTDLVAYSRDVGAMRQTAGSTLPCHTEPWSCQIEDEVVTLIRFPPAGGLIASPLPTGLNSLFADRTTDLPIDLPLIGIQQTADAYLPLPEWTSADIDGDHVPELISVEAVPGGGSGATNVTLRITPHFITEDASGNLRAPANRGAPPLTILNYQLINGTLDSFGNAYFQDPADLTSRLMWVEHNGDGRSDLLVQGFSGSQLVLVPYVGRGDGSFASKPQIDTGMNFALIESLQNARNHYAQNGGTSTECFSPGVVCCPPTGNNFCRANESVRASGLTLLQADLNGDGIDDLFASNEFASAVAWTGNPTGTAVTASGTSSVSTMTLILGPDGIVETRGNVWGAAAAPVAQYTWRVQASTNFVETRHGWLIADFDGDGVNDIAWTDFSGASTTSVRVFPQEASATNLASTRWIDISGEGIPDIVRLDPLRNEIRSVVRTASGTTQVTAFIPTGRVGQIVSGDFGSVGDTKADGKTDFAWVTSDGGFPGSAWLRIAYSRGDGQFYMSSIPTSGGMGYVSTRWNAVDLDGDRTDELVQVLSEGSATTIRSLRRDTVSGWAGSATQVLLPDATLGSGAWQQARVSGGERAEFLRVTVGGPSTANGVTVDRLIQTAFGWEVDTQAVALSLCVPQFGNGAPACTQTLFRGQFRSGDVNGDGVTDLVRVARDRDRIANLLTVTQLVGSGRRAPNAYALTGFEVVAPANIEVELNGGAWMQGDLDNDGLEDFTQVARGQGSGNIYTYVHVLHRTGASAARWERFSMAALGPTADDDTGAWTLADVVGRGERPDGRLDLVRPYAWHPPGKAPDGTIGVSVFGADMAPPAIVREVTGYGLETELTYVSSKGHHNGLLTGMAETNIASIRRKIEPTGDYSYLAYTYDNFRYDHAMRRSLSYQTAAAESSQHVTAGVRLTIENEPDPICSGRRTRELLELQGGGGKLTEMVRSYEKSTANHNNVCILASELTGRFEYSSTPLLTRKRFERNSWGSVTVIHDDGKYVDTNKDGIDEDTSDNRRTEIEFVENPTKYLIAFPALTTRYGPGNQLVGQERFSYDLQRFGDKPTVGNATMKEEWDDEGSQWIATNVTYWPNGAPRRTEGPNGVWQETTYDSAQGLFPESVCNAVFCNTQRWNMRFGKLDRNEDANGEVTSYSYDVFGRLTRTTFNDGACLMHTWGNLGDPKKQFSFEGVCSKPGEEPDPRNSMGVVTHFDGMMRPWRQVRQATYERFVKHWGTTTLVRSAETWHAIGGSGTTTETFYEYLGRPARVTNPDGSERHIGYAPGHIAAEDENGNLRELFRDARGNLLMSRDWHDAPNQGWVPVEATFEYDDADRLTQATDPLGGITSAKFNSLGWRLQNCDPDRGCMDFRYYADGQLQSSNDARGMKVDYTYDRLGRLERRTTDRNGVTVVLERNWWDEDPVLGGPAGFSVGRVARRQDEAGESAFTYDNRGRPATQQRATSALGTMAFAEWQMAFDLVGRPSALTYPDSNGVISGNSEVLEYDYDSLGRVERMWSQLGVYLEKATYDPEDRIDAAVFGNGVVEKSYYDPQRKWMTGLEVIPAYGDGLALGYQYDVAGRPEHHTWSDPAFHQLDFAYDTLDRLVDVTGDLRQHFAYDNAGRMTFNSAAGSYYYGSPTSHGVTTAGQIRLAYDPSGNAKTIDSNRLEWDENSRLVRGTTNSGNVAWGYAPDGSRVFKVLSHKPVFYFGGLIEQENGNLRYFYKIGDRVIAERNGSRVEWLHRDLVSSTRAISDASGAIARRFDYEPFGREYQSTGQRPTLGYRADHYDEETGLVLLGARYYHPEIGRFISADSVIPDIENTQAHDRYAYAYNSPIGLVDPSGHVPKAANQAEQAHIRGSAEERNRQVPLYDYCKTHPDDVKCNSPDGGPEPISVKPVDPAMAALAIHNRQGKTAQDGQENWNLQTAAVSVGARLWNLINTGTWTEQVVLEVGEDTGINSLVRAGTGEDILSSKLSTEQRIENAVEGTGKLLETGVNVAAVVEVGTAALARKATGAAVEGGLSEGTSVIRGGGCFAAGTPVLTPSGPQPIESIRVGDQVLALDVQSGTVTRRHVLTTSALLSATLVLQIATASGATSTLRATAEHPFLLCDTRWVEASLLRPGDCLLTGTGTAVLVSSGDVDRDEQVFNFEVEEDNDYFVGELAVAVHNNSSISRPPGLNSVGGEGYVGSVPKPPRGDGSVPSALRDPQRRFSDTEKAAQRALQGDKCPGCNGSIDATNSRGHHVKRHADGGPTTQANHAQVCIDCHDDLHRP
ncbi:MAG: FG-GAP-like repeat-containing protein [Archangium sp.]|nr:FG-GAP-like repeat-containing protein [Archangium sp.]